MKNENQRRHRPAILQNARWGAYAAAGAATALTGIGSAEAEIHYSGILNERITCKGTGGTCFKFKDFQLDQPGDSFRLHVSVTSASNTVGSAGLAVRGVGAISFGGFITPPSHSYVSRLSRGQNISTAPLGFIQGGVARNSINMAYGVNESADWQWRVRGTGFIAFKFDSGQGPQYGWARVTTPKDRKNSLLLVDYAWGDPGDIVLAGDTGEGAVPELVPASGSLGWLGLGGAGLLAWRRSRGKTDR